MSSSLIKFEINNLPSSVAENTVKDPFQVSMTMNQAVWKAPG